jgi:hypothetical protein
MLTSKKPSKGAKLFHPLATKMVRTVDSVTTQVSAKKTNSGRVKIISEIPVRGPSQV